MPPKKKRGKKAEVSKNPPVFQKNASHCAKGPGPKYKLKTLVGYNDHCASRNRNPAYSLAAKQNVNNCTIGPGPIYYATLPKSQGFTMGHALTGTITKAGPGPYLPPDPPRIPAFSMKWRTEYRGGATRAGPYNLPSGMDGPAYSMGLKLMGNRCAGGPGPSPRFSVDTVRPKAPAYSLGWGYSNSVKWGGPGPYNPHEVPKLPAYSFGVKHSPCSPPYITECDDMC